VHAGFLWRDLREGDRLEDLGEDGRTILKWIFKKWDGQSMDSIDLAQNRDRWLALVNSILNLPVPQNAKKFLSSRGPGSVLGRTLLHRVSQFAIPLSPLLKNCSVARNRKYRNARSKRYN
jgi:hypothetical protein